MGFNSLMVISHHRSNVCPICTHMVIAARTSNILRYETISGRDALFGVVEDIHRDCCEKDYLGLEIPRIFQGPDAITDLL